MTPDDLKHWRQRAGLSQTGLAALLGIHAMTVSKWERGIATIPTFLDLALEALNARAGRSPKRPHPRRDARDRAIL